MFAWLLRPVRFLVKAFGSEDTPHQLAWGVAIGMMVGLLPKENLTAVVLSVLLLATRVNPASGAVAVLAFSWVGLLIDPVCGRIGWFLLSHPALQGVWTTLADLPVAPWTAFNNTVVLGSFVVGLWLLLPVYFVSKPLFARYHPRLTARLRKFKVYQVLMGTEVANTWRIG